MNQIKAEKIEGAYQSFIAFYGVFSDDFCNGIITGDGEFVPAWKPRGD